MNCRGKERDVEGVVHNEMESGAFNAELRYTEENVHASSPYYPGKQGFPAHWRC